MAGRCVMRCCPCTATKSSWPRRTLASPRWGYRAPHRHACPRRRSRRVPHAGIQHQGSSLDSDTRHMSLRGVVHLLQRYLLNSAEACKGNRPPARRSIAMSSRIQVAVVHDNFLTRAGLTATFAACADMAVRAMDSSDAELPDFDVACRDLRSGPWPSWMPDGGAGVLTRGPESRSLPVRISSGKSAKAVECGAGRLHVAGRDRRGSCWRFAFGAPGRMPTCRLRSRPSSRRALPPNPSPRGRKRCSRW